MQAHKVYVQLFIFVLFIIKTSSESIYMNGECPDLGSKLPCNWLAMGGNWFEVQRSAENSAFQLGTTCVTYNITNVGRYIILEHSYKNVLNQIKRHLSVFPLSSDPTVEICFMPGITKALTLMGTDYLNAAVFYMCEPVSKIKTNPISKLDFWVLCRRNQNTRGCTDMTKIIFKVRHVENLIPYLTNTLQTCN